ncbi:MAG TPA: deoxynucleoside kinase [Bacteroidia bacterium]|nr:deoxynucleoside kinase [Bacteroidia bacterium]
MKYIAIEGIIGAGKSTFAKALSKKLGGRLVLEDFEANSLLADFYRDPKRYARQLELTLLQQRVKQLKSSHSNDSGILIADFHLHKSLLFAAITLNPQDYVEFEKIYLSVIAGLPEPDLLIHISTPPKQAKQNIINRGRPYETAISEVYLDLLFKGYSGFIRNYCITKSVLTIRWDELQSKSDTKIAEIMQLLSAQ